MSHEEYVQSVRRQVIEVCSGMLSGAIPLLEGCHSLASLRWEVEVDERDADFFSFAMISSEIDALPIGKVRAHWAPEALAELEPQIQSAMEWATPQALPACRSMVERFGG
jgi:hypothetical protein